MPDLILPTTRLHAAFLECRDDWGSGIHEDGFGLNAEDDVESPDGFSAWVDRLLQNAHSAEDPCPGGEHGTLRWIVEEDQILGAIALRHKPNDSLGQIGYGMRPAARRRGLATWALGEMLGEAKALGMDSVLIVCATDNIASASTIEHNGGVLEGIVETERGPRKRYWIALK